MATGGQDENAEQLILKNLKNILIDLNRKLESRDLAFLDYVFYKLDWISVVLLRLGKHDNLLDSILKAKQILEEVVGNIPSRQTRYTPRLSFSENRGRPRFDIPKENLEYLLESGFKATDIATILGVSSKTVARRLEQYGIPVRTTYSQLSDQDLDLVIQDIIKEFPNCGYKSMRGHLLSKGLKIQEDRVRVAMRRLDPEGVLLRALQIRVTHRRTYNVKAPLSLWHMDGHHKLIRFVFINIAMSIYSKY